MIGQAQPVGYKQFKGMLATVFRGIDTPLNLTEFTQMVARTNSVSISKRDFSRAVRDFKQSSRSAILACTSCGHEYLFPATVAADMRTCPTCTPKKKDEPEMPVNQDQPSFTPYKLGRMRDILSELRKKHGDDIVVYNQKKDLRDEIASSIDEITPANAYWYIDSLLKLGAATHDKSSILVDTTYAISVPEENENTVTESAVTDKTMTEQATSFEHIDTLLPDNELPADEAIERLLALLLSARRELLHRDETINQLYTQLNDTNSKLEQVNAQAESSRMSADSLRQDNVKLRQRVSELEQTLTEAEQLATALEQQLTYATTKKVNLRQLYAKVSDKS